MDQGKVFYLTVMLWANTTVENMRGRLMVHGGHDEKAWSSGTDQETIFTLAPLVFGSNWEAMQVLHRPPESSDKGQRLGNLLEQEDPTWGPIRGLKRAEIRGRIILTLREERGLYGNIVTMSESPTVGFTHLSDNRGGEHHPALIWVIDETEPARVLLTVHCVFDRYHMLAYLAQVFGPLIRDFRAPEIEHVCHFALEELPDDLRAYYLTVVTTIGSRERTPFSDTWGYGGRLPEHRTSYGRLSEAQATTQPAIPQPIELDARRLADIERRLLKGRIFKEKHSRTRRGPEDVRVIIRGAGTPPPASAQQKPALTASDRAVGKTKKDRIEYRRGRVQAGRARVPKTTIEDLAEELGCSEATIMRDMKALGIK